MRTHVDPAPDRLEPGPARLSGLHSKSFRGTPEEVEAVETEFLRLFGSRGPGS